MKNLVKIFVFYSLLVGSSFWNCVYAGEHVSVPDRFYTKDVKNAVPYAHFIKNTDDLIGVYVEFKKKPYDEAKDFVDGLGINLSTQKVILIVGDEHSVIDKDKIETKYSPDGILTVNVEIRPLPRPDQQEDSRIMESMWGYPVAVLATNPKLVPLKNNIVDPNTGRATIKKLVKIICCEKNKTCDDNNNLGVWPEQE